jgi:hypothetical protein
MYGYTQLKLFSSNIHPVWTVWHGLKPYSLAALIHDPPRPLPAELNRITDATATTTTTTTTSMTLQLCWLSLAAAQTECVRDVRFGVSVFFYFRTLKYTFEYTWEILFPAPSCDPFS